MPDDRVSVIDPFTRKVLDTINVGKGVHGVAISNDGAYVFINNMESGTFSVIDAASRQVAATHKVGAGRDGISYQP
ncbi:MAG: YncE family protein [Burkholderiaceae bacterium]